MAISEIPDGTEDQGPGRLGNKPASRKRVGRKPAHHEVVDERPPAWAAGMLTNVNNLVDAQLKTNDILRDYSRRIDKLEKRPVAEPERELTAKELFDMGIPPAEWPKYRNRQPNVPAIQALHCELCGELYQGEKPKLLGTPQLCEDCKIPGRKVARCDCGKIIKGYEGGEARCKECQKCIRCGTKESRQVCARCVRSGVITCDGCRCLPMRGSAFCMTCDADYKNKNAGQFDKLKMPDPDPRAMNDAETALIQANRIGDVHAAENLASFPDLQPALPGR